MTPVFAHKGFTLEQTLLVSHRFLHSQWAPQSHDSENTSQFPTDGKDKIADGHHGLCLWKSMILKPYILVVVF